MNSIVIPPKPEGVTWTNDQWKAIAARDKDILVAAAAGSGKTAVLVERIIQKILSKEVPIDVDQLLVVTFTSASAAEMRHRIGEALEKAIDQNPESRNLRKQLNLLNKASISTLHSFCMEVIRKYYYLIDIDPGFRIADPTEAQLIRDEVMEELFEEEYGKKENEAFFNLVDSFTSDRSDAALMDIVRSIYDFAQSNPLPDRYLEKIVAMYQVEEIASIEELPFIDALLFDIKLQLEAAKEMIKQALEITKQPNGPAPRAENFLDDLEVIDTLIKAEQNSWNTLNQAMQTWSFTRAKQVKGDHYDKELIEKAQKLRDKAKKKIQGIKDELFSRRPESFLRDMVEMRPLIATLVYLVKEFSKRFEKAKQEKALVDYNDLEHYCLAILTKGISDKGEFLPSEAAIAYRLHFKEVYCDEYQDTNLVQETILKLVAQDEEENGNLFMVGDVKQSIYRFRLAEPQLFLSKYNRFTADGSASGLRIDLAQNFRSRKEVLDATNYLFKQIMGVKVGEIQYDEAAELRNGAPYPENTEFPVELMLIDQNAESHKSEELETENENEAVEFDTADLEQSQLEARVIAAKIKKLISDGVPVFNAKTKTERPLMYRDVVILLRSMTWAPQFMEEFKQQGIPIYANLSTGYFEATEVSIMMSLLRVIDNPYQDIPLASVLRSPIVGLNEEELSKIRIGRKRGSFWEAVTAFCLSKTTEVNEPFYEKVRAFFDLLTEWRSLARQGSLSELIWQLYRDTQFYDFTGGLPGGKQRQANLRALYDRARQYEQTSFRGLFRFLRFIERMMERGDDLGAARALGEQEDVVRIMTIHSSKGLEFPVVFMAGMARNFNMTDIRKPYMLDKEHGFAAKYVNAEKRISYPSLPQIAFKQKKRMEMLAEEMRVLYVAMTRAKEKLYVTATLKDAGKQIDKWKDVSLHNEWLLKDYERASAMSYIDWIGPALIRHQDASELWNGGEGNWRMPEEISNHPSSWKITLQHADEIKKQAISIENEEDHFLKKVENLEQVPSDSNLTDEIHARLTWEYPFPGAASHRSKQSVSEIKRVRELTDEYSSTELVGRFQKSILKRPKFMQEKQLSPAERGTAMHMVMQHVDLTKEVNQKNIVDQLSWMVNNELLTPEQSEVIDAKLIAQFFTSPLGQRFYKAKTVHREVPFTVSLPASEVYPDWNEGDESVFVQGIIDCILEDEDGLVLIDYKSDGITDRYKGGFQQAKVILEDRYKLQINLYTKAIEQIWKRNVVERYLFFFDGAHILKVEK
ncbi:DNA helicase/exodeoxyribonuclease V subunit A [Neobacillus bataviensis]|uniref:ATP-dependent helicase/nuclease subunit A n=1 Tax=Neobacillus bataviensis TaxID=220685 RepID=A0A561CQX6_9BACI|nr:helicase-exonuclease AddAB subunit AddA [Neobacillus bataviensis]TWD93633.1 DNA helicase/exodeoxyribonuclease V subunit A [Neobacillus bataviensis]